jgi:hypothetical protein
VVMQICLLTVKCAMVPLVSAQDIVLIMREVGPLLLGLATLATAVGALRSSKRNETAIAENTEVTVANKETGDRQMGAIHKLVNNMNTASLGREAGQADRIADLTGDPGDQRAAIQARSEYDTKKSVDAQVVEDARVATEKDAAKAAKKEP